ncbi:MAG: head GIN domain-containing protein [Chitinophagaceae bacterium]
MKNVLLLLMMVAVTMSSCNYMGGKRVKGNGNIKSTEHSVSSFKNVDVSGSIDLYVAQGEVKPVKIETDENLLQYIEVIQEGDRVEIRTRDGFNLNPSGKIKVYVTTTLYNKIEVSGASNINGVGKIVNTEKMSMDVSGAGDINMELNAPAISAEVSGAGAVNLKGETKTFDLTLTGAGKAHCFELLSENTKVDISGAGDADVYASVKLEAQVSGAGSVAYKGGGTSDSHVSGAGSVKKSD